MKSKYQTRFFIYQKTTYIYIHINLMERQWIHHQAHHFSSKLHGLCGQIRPNSNMNSIHHTREPIWNKLCENKTAEYFTVWLINNILAARWKMIQNPVPSLGQTDPSFHVLMPENQLHFLQKKVHSCLAVFTKNETRNSSKMNILLKKHIREMLCFIMLWCLNLNLQAVAELNN